MDLGIKGLRVVVTAGAAGIGREVARTFMREGAQVQVCDVDREALAALATSDPKLKAALCDVSDRDAVTRFIDSAAGALGGLDCLINNAGIAGPTGRVDEIPPEEWDHTLAVNITGQFNCARAALRHLTKSSNPRSSIYPRRRAASVFRCARLMPPRNGRSSALPNRSRSSSGRSRFASTRSSPGPSRATGFGGYSRPRHRSAACPCKRSPTKRCRMPRSRK